MKTLRTIAAILLAAFMVFGPTVAFAAGETVTVATNSTTYAGASVVQVSGTVSPAPTVSNTAVVVTTKGPQGVVDTGTATVAMGTGAYQYTFVAGGSTMWVSGTYVVNATYGGPGGSGSGTASFGYTASSTGGGGGPQGVSVQVTASTPVVSGTGQVTVAILTSFQSNGSLAGATFQTVHYHTPAGTLVTLCSSSPPAAGCSGSFTTVHKGFYLINFSAPSGVGGYFVHAWANGPQVNGVSTGQGQGLGQFTVVAAGSTTGGGGNTALENNIMGNLTQIKTSLSSIQTAVTALQQGVTTLSQGFTQINTGITTITQNTNGLSGLSGQLNTISTGVTQIQSTLGGISNGLAGLAGAQTQLTNLTNAVNNNQTYVLVVAALAAITLVLELAILVRKLS